MICHLPNSYNYIDLSKPIEGCWSDSVYPFGFIVYSHVANYSCKHPDRCEYLLTELIDPTLLQDFLANWRDTHPELLI